MKEQTTMRRDDIKETIQKLLERTENEELLNRCLELLQEGAPSPKKDIFDTTDDEMVARTEESMKAIREGRTITLEQFRENVDKWKRERRGLTK